MALGMKWLVEKALSFPKEKQAGNKRGAFSNPCDKTLADIVSQPNHPVRSAPEERQRGEREQNTGENGSAGRKAKPQKQAKDCVCSAFIFQRVCVCVYQPQLGRH